MLTEMSLLVVASWAGLPPSLQYGEGGDGWPICIVFVVLLAVTG